MRPLLLSLVAIVSFAFGQTVYVLQDDYTAGSTAGSFADNFDFFTVRILEYFVINGGSIKSRITILQTVM